MSKPVKKKGSRPPQERGKRTREAILKAAVQNLAEHNVYGMRYAQIAKSAGVPQPLLDYHFPSLDALLGEMIAYELEKLKVFSLEAIESARSPEKALDNYIRAPFNLADGDRGFRAVWSLYYHLAMVTSTFGDFNRVVRKTGHERIMTLVSRILQKRRGENLPVNKLLQDTATSIQGVITGFGFMAGAETGGDFKALADLAVKAAFQILEANFPE